ncbi:hypothetical protein Tco_0676631 [Tanacetum coccineum]
MEALKFVDSHNMIAYLEKSIEIVDFDEIVDFLNANPIRYALTIKTVNNERQMRAKVDGKTIVTSKSSVRRDLQFNDEDDEIVHEERGDSVERAATTAASLDVEHDSGNILRTQSMPTLNDPIPQGTSSGSGPRCQDTILGDIPAQTRFKRLSKQSNDPPLSRVNTLRSGADKMQLQELMEMCTKLSDRVLDLEDVKNTQALEIQKLKKRGRNEFDQDEGTSFIQEDVETQGRYGHNFNITTASAPITTAGVSVSTAEPNKGKGIMQDLEKPVKVKGKDQIVADEEVARRLEAKIQAKLEEEERLARPREEEANLISWDNTQAMMEADYELAHRLQAKK